MKSDADWPFMAAEAMMLTHDALWVIGLRTAVLAGGGNRAQQELALMTSEKLIAHVNFAAKLATGRAGATPDAVTTQALRHYGPLVRANRRRLAGK